MRVLRRIEKVFHRVKRSPESNVVKKKVKDSSCFREISSDKIDEFFEKGYQKRYFFPHKIYYLPKCGPDALRLARRMCGESIPNQHWEVLLHATRSLDEFPEELFFDNDLIWHQQQLGKTGHIAYACLVIKGSNLYGLNYVSDLVQRISRKREYKTRIENRFKGWPHMLLNSIMNFAMENNIKKVYSPTSKLAIENTDPRRTVQRELFERVYDRAVNKRSGVKREGKWWVIDVADNIDRTVIPERKQEMMNMGKTVCLCHDIERGRGHIDVDTDFSEEANKVSPKYLEEMLTVEKEMNVKATYNVVGCFLDEVRERIEKDGHCIAFHSYDHKVHNIRSNSRRYYKIFKKISGIVMGKTHNRYGGQPAKCRGIDYRIKGYRPPMSKITSDLSDDNLCFHNFEWLANSPSSLKTQVPIIQNRVVKIPIFFDDFGLYKGKVNYEEWEQRAINIIKKQDFVAFCLHDCYTQFWLPHYREFLKKISGLGKLKTLNEVANEVMLCRGT